MKSRKEYHVVIRGSHERTNEWRVRGSDREDSWRERMKERDKQKERQTTGRKTLSEREYYGMRDTQREVTYLYRLIER